ncbi:MAG: DUF4316 domain-containing protein [Stomatobaculum sp.]
MGPPEKLAAEIGHFAYENDTYEYKPLAKVEDMEEENYNMIDNVINNLRQTPKKRKNLRH